MKNIKIGPKLVAAFLIVVVFSAAMGIYLIGSIKELREQTHLLTAKGSEPLGMLVKATEQLQEMRISLWQWQREKDAERRDSLARNMQNSYNDCKELIKKQRELVLQESGKKFLDDLTNSIDKFMEEVQNYMKGSKIDANGSRETLWPSVAERAKVMLVALHAAINKRISATDEVAADARVLAKTSEEVATLILVIVLVFSLFICFVLTASITSPLHTVVGVLSKIEKGDMTNISNLKRKDELGMLSKALDSVSSKLQSIFRDFQQDADLLACHADELTDVSSQMAAAAEENVVQSTSISITAEKASSNINSIASNAEQASLNSAEVAAAAEQMSANMNTIAAAREEMSANIGQISNNAVEASKVANQANTKSDSATEVMGKLGSAAKEIGKVTDVMKRVADKTNLLALNATIEAAAAGEAGKSFAVVASEIKELAGQSAQSADDIARRVESIQSGTVKAVNVIHEVSDIIVQINHGVESISNYAGQQTKSSNEIASSVAQANAAARRVASAIGEVAKGSKDIARNIKEVSNSANSVHQGTEAITRVAKDGVMGSKKIHEDAGKLAKIAGELKKAMNQFRI
jgi:methyl-accepting chemotaxis protein